jgi:AcrR family transcriptional regulator
MALMPRISAVDRRAQLLDAAWRVLLTDGVAGATTRAICAEAGMPQGVFHYCFSSRDELLTEVAAVMLPREMNAAGQTIGRGGTLVDTVHRALLAYWELVETEPRVHQVIYEITALALREPALSAPTRGRYAGYPAAVAAVLERIAEVRGIVWDRSVPVLATQIVAVLDGLTLQYLIRGDAGTARAALLACAQDVAARGRRARRATVTSVLAGAAR